MQLNPCVGKGFTRTSSVRSYEVILDVGPSCISRFVLWGLLVKSAPTTHRRVMTDLRNHGERLKTGVCPIFTPRCGCSRSDLR